MQLMGTYAGTVEAVADPAKLGRVKTRVPCVHGVQGSVGGFIATNDLSWAFPAGLPAGGTSDSGGFSHLPRIGDHVWVRFLDGEPEKPIWEWGNQDQDQIAAQPLNTYNAQTGQPIDRSFWTRFNHSIEISTDSVLMTTATGYAIQLFAGDTNATNGFIRITTPRGHQVEMDDDTQSMTINAVEDFYLNVPDEMAVLSQSIEMTAIEEMTYTIGTDLTISVTEDIDISSVLSTTMAASTSMELTAGTTMSLQAASTMDLEYALLRLGGASSTQPLVLGTQLTSFLSSLFIYLSTHTHGNGNNGSPTSPPLIPPIATVTPQIAQLVSTTAFTQ